jgi:hypothetical protein
MTTGRNLYPVENIPIELDFLKALLSFNTAKKNLKKKYKIRKNTKDFYNRKYIHIY